MKNLTRDLSERYEAGCDRCRRDGAPGPLVSSRAEAEAVFPLATIVENRVHIHELNATILHSFGIGHEKLTRRFPAGSRQVPRSDRRLGLVERPRS